MRGIAGDELDLLVIHADCSMAHNVEALRDCPPASATADALQEVIRNDWLRLSSLPNWIVLMTPSKTTDTWFLVGNGRTIRGELEPIECSFEIEAELARLRIYRWKAGRVKKGGDSVEAIAIRSAQGWKTVLSRCTEASRFWLDFQAAAAS